MMDDFPFRKLEDRMSMAGDMETGSEREARLLRLEFIKAAMAGYAANSAEWIKNASTSDTAKLAIQLADCTLAAAGEKGA